VAEALGGAADLPELILAYAGPSVYDLGAGPLQAYRKLVRTLERSSAFGTHADGEFHADWLDHSDPTFLLFDVLTHNSARGKDALLNAEWCGIIEHPGVCRILRHANGVATVDLCKEVIAEEVVRAFVGPWVVRYNPEPSRRAWIERMLDFSSSVLESADLFYFTEPRTRDEHGYVCEETLAVGIHKADLAVARTRFPTLAPVLPRARRPSQRRTRKRSAKRRSPRLAKKGRATL
jgi:hypothetical protein